MRKRAVYVHGHLKDRFIKDNLRSVMSKPSAGLNNTRPPLPAINTSFNQGMIASDLIEYVWHSLIAAVINMNKLYSTKQIGQNERDSYFSIDALTSFFMGENKLTCDEN